MATTVNPCTTGTQQAITQTLINISSSKITIITNPETILTPVESIIVTETMPISPIDSTHSLLAITIADQDRKSNLRNEIMAQVAAVRLIR